MRATLLAVAATALVGTVAQAAVLDSNLFPYKYEADAKPGVSTPAWTRTGLGANDNLLASVSSGVLTINTDPTNDPGVGTQSWNLYTISSASAAWTVEAGKGFAAEMRVLVNDAPDNPANNTTKSRSGLRFAIGDGTRQATITILDSEVRATGSQTVAPTVFNTATNKGSWHTFQIVVSDDHLSYNVYRDSVLVTATPQATVLFAANSILFGDDNNSGSTATNQGRDINVSVDYVRWNAAIPEPASLAVIGFGGLMLLRRRR